MRNRIAAANWKMNLTLDEACALAGTLVETLKSIDLGGKQVILATPYLYLSTVADIIKSNKNIFVAAQDCSEHLSGAYTGEVSATMLYSAGITHVIIGHSERRTYHQEKDEALKTKVENALTNNLKVIFCCGEQLSHREQMKHFNLIEGQLWHGLFHLDETQIINCAIAYEPVWAIGTGVTASPAQAAEMHSFIRKLLIEKYGESTANEISILYGGSCNEKNAAELFSNTDIDGGLIGGASLKADSFIKIIQSL